MATSYNQVTDEGRHAKNRAKKMKKGRYSLAFTKSYEGLTDNELNNRLTYAQQLIGDYIHTPMDMIRLEEKEFTVGYASRTEVYYVYVGKMVAGKVSIRVQRARNLNYLRFAYQVKQIHTGSGGF